MTAIPLPPRAAYTDEPVYRLTVAQYHDLIRSGGLAPDDLVELVEGILVFKMPKNTPHLAGTRLCRRTVTPLLPAGWFYDEQAPVTLTDGEPEPDGLILRGRVEDYLDRHPGPDDVAVVIEVADSPLTRDRTSKLRSYARAGIATYWIVNLIDRQVEVYTDPDRTTAAYRGRLIVTGTDRVSLSVGGQELDGVTADGIMPPRIG